jgi:hypothetical protein
LLVGYFVGVRRYRPPLIVGNGAVDLGRTGRVRPALGCRQGLTAARRPSLPALPKKAPSLYGWCRTRWSGEALAETRWPRRGGRVSAETVRRWWQRALGWSGKRAKLVANDEAPERVSKRAPIRWLGERWRPRPVRPFADEWDIHLLPKTGSQRMPKGTQVEVMTPGQNEKRYRAAAWEVRTGKVHPRVWASQTNALFRDWLDTLATACPAQR